MIQTNSMHSFDFWLFRLQTVTIGIASETLNDWADEEAGLEAVQRVLDSLDDIHALQDEYVDEHVLRDMLSDNRLSALLQVSRHEFYIPIDINHNIIQKINLRNVLKNKTKQKTNWEPFPDDVDTDETHSIFLLHNHLFSVIWFSSQRTANCECALWDCYTTQLSFMFDSLAKALGTTLIY